MTDFDGPSTTSLFTGACDFTAGVAKIEQLPDSDLPEVAFAGRSNVGKSSLINALTGRKALARTSNTPGRTQQLNFFSVGGLFYLVDMPGYGYAQVSRQTKTDWENLIRDYLRGRPTLRCVFILVDTRHGLKDSDHELMDVLDEAAVPCRIIFTKADKANDRERNALIQETIAALQRHAAVWPQPMFTSAAEKQGLVELRDVIVELTT